MARSHRNKLSQRFESLRGRYVSLREGYGTSTVFVVVFLLILWGALGYYLLEGTKPWDTKFTQRLEAGKSFRVSDYALYYSWWAAAFNFLAFSVLIASTPWWPKVQRSSLGTGPLGEPRRCGGLWFWAVVLSAVLFASVYRAPRLSHSLWNDEEYSFRTYSWGKYETLDDDTLRFRAVPFRDALFKNTNGNNHLWHTLEARLGLAAWSLFRGDSTAPAFNEAAARTLPFLSGLLSVFAIAVLGSWAGSSRAGAAAAWLLALSPWHVRYAVEARGYSTLLLAILIMLACAIRAFETGRWRWWFGASAAQAVALLSFLGSIYVILVFNAAIGLGLLIQLRRRPDFKAQIIRWATASTVAMSSVVQLMLPSVPQILAYLNREDHQSNITMGWDWFVHLLCHLSIGVPLVLNQSGAAGVTHHGISVADMSIETPLVPVFVAMLVPALTMVGIAAMIASGWRWRLIALSLWGGGVAAYLHNALAGSKMYIWYLLYLFLASALSIAFGVVFVSKRFSRDRWTSAIALAVLIALTAWITHPPRARISEFERQPIREVVTVTRGQSPAFGTTDGGFLTGSFGVSDRQIFSYDPRAVIVRELADLKALMERADSEEKQLFVVFCGREETSSRHPETFAEVTKSGRFDRVTGAPGMEEYFTYEVWGYRPTR